MNARIIHRSRPESCGFIPILACRWRRPAISSGNPVPVSCWRKAIQYVIPRIPSLAAVPAGERLCMEPHPSWLKLIMYFPRRSIGAAVSSPVLELGSRPCWCVFWVAGAGDRRVSAANGQSYLFGVVMRQVARNHILTCSSSEPASEHRIEHEAIDCLTQGTWIIGVNQ